jgi:hypothetical protein
VSFIKGVYFMISNLFSIVIVSTLIFNASVYANEAKKAMDKVEARQKVRMHTDKIKMNDRYVHRRRWRGEDCNVNIARTYVEERKQGRELNVYSYVDGDVNVRCN